MRPCSATVGRLVNPVANRNAVACPRFTSSDPDVFRIFWVERDRTDRLDRLFIKHRSVSRPAIIRFPDSATRCTDKKRDLARWLACARDGRNTAAHCCRAYVACAEARDGCGIEWSFLRPARNYAEEEQ